MEPLFNQSDRSLYSMLTDAYVGRFVNYKLSDKDLAPKTFASEPNGGFLTQSWMVVITAFLSSSDLEALRSNAKTLEKSKELIESIAGHTLLWAIANHEYNRSREKAKIVIDDVINDLLKE